MMDMSCTTQRHCLHFRVWESETRVGRLPWEKVLPNIPSFQSFNCSSPSRNVRATVFHYSFVFLMGACFLHLCSVSGLRCSLNGLTPLMSWWLEIIFPAQTFLLSSWSTHMTIASPASLTQYIQIEFISSSPCPTNKSALISVELEVSTLVLLSLWTNPFTHQIL